MVCTHRRSWALFPSLRAEALRRDALRHEGLLQDRILRQLRARSLQKYAKDKSRRDSASPADWDRGTVARFLHPDILVLMHDLRNPSE